MLCFYKEEFAIWKCFCSL